MPPALPCRCAYLALLLSSLQPATAMLLYDNGPESAAGGIRLDETVIAQDFRLAAAALIDTVTFAGTERFVPSDFAWRIYADNSGKPGALLLEGSGTAVRTFLGTTATATRYRYTLDCPDLSPFAGEFSTAPPLGDPRPLLLAVFGDEQASPNNDSVSSRSIVQAVLAEAPDLVIGTGDLVGEGGSKDDWRELSKTHQPLWSQLLYLPALGNHELLGDYDGSFFRRLLPQAESRFYAVRYGFLQLIFLDGNQPGSQPQTHFLATQLKSTQGDKSVRARIVVLHQPPLSVGLHCGTSGSMHEWMHIFEKYRVDAVLAGHDHAYERLERNGVPYFVTGGGGAKLYDQSPCGQPDEPALQRYESVHHYLMVELKPLADRVEISLRAQVPQGMPFDKVTLPLAPSAVGQIHKDSDEPGPPRRWHRGHLLYVLRHHGLQLGVALVFGAVVVAAWRYGRRRSS